MRFICKVMFCLMAFAMLPLAAQVPVFQPISTGESKKPVTFDAVDLEAWLDGYVPYALERGHIPGAAVVVVRGDKVLLQKGYGFSDVAKRTAVDPATTLFRPGSISKLFTSTAVMQLIEAGKLDLDQDINSYLDFKIPPYQGKPITLRHLMTHTAGFEESLRYLFSADPKAAMALKKLMPLALPQRVYAPGTTPAYSNYGMALLGYIVERVSGELFEEYVENHIFKPLDMKYSSFRQPLPGRLAPLMSQGYSDITQKPQPFEIVIPAPAGSLSASGADMGKFMMAHLNEGAGLMKADTARLMHDYKAPAIGPLNRMALGFYEQRVNGHRTIAHDGDTAWFHSYLWLFPDADIGLYISLNATGKDSAEESVGFALFHKFADRYLSGEDKAGAVDDKTARSHAEAMTGTYVASRRAFTSFLSIFSLLEQVRVSLTEDGKISVSQLYGLNMENPDWVEIEPYVWRDLSSGERLAAEVKNGRVVRFGIDALPYMVFAPAPARVNAALFIPAFRAALAIILLAAIAWPFRALVRRNFGVPAPFEGRALHVFRLSRIFAWLVLAALAGWFGFFATISDDIGALGGSLDWLIQSLRILTPVAAIGLLAMSAWHFWMCWTTKHHWAANLGALLLLLAAFPIIWLTFSFNLYGFSLVF